MSTQGDVRKELIIQVINWKCHNFTERKTIDSFAHLQKGKNTNRQCETAYSITQGGLVLTSDFFKTIKVTSEDTSGYRIVRKNWFVYSPSRIDVGSINYLRDQEEVIVSPLNVVFSVDEKDILPGYLLHYLRSSDGVWQTVTKIEGIGGTGRKLLPFEKFSQISVPIPPIPIQKAIVEILDQFNTYCTDLTNGLPAEIAARKKQYEYYRDLLLTFPAESEGD